jgi:hypothetical protein
MATKKRPSASPHIILSGAKIVIILHPTKKMLKKSIPKVSQHASGIAAAELTQTLAVEMQMVTTGLASVCGNNQSLRQSLRQLSHNLIVSGALATLIGRNNLT